MQHLKNHILPYVLIPLLVLTTAASYYRFMILHDHPVSYEGFCDPATESCFVGCEEDVDSMADCPANMLYYFTEVERHAADLMTLCGNDITDCAAANVCIENDSDCSVTYCDPAIDTDESGTALCDTETTTNPENN